MQSLSLAPAGEFSGVQFVLTDMDETLTYQGRLAASTYDALERLQAAGVRVMPVTAAPAGWGDQMARMWPVDGVIAENGGIFMRRDAQGHGVERSWWADEADVTPMRNRLASIAARVASAVPDARVADDQVFRLASLAWQRTGTSRDGQIVAALRAAGAETAVNNLWVLGWLGGYDKLSMSLRVLTDAYGVAPATAAEVVAYSGDSTNDAPMFGYFRHTVGVSTVVDCLPQLPVAPRWVTAGPGGAGFVEFANAILRARGV
ncbi:HAD-IIB family hydrolase [Paraburkholderia bannensis]|uniref:HAD-IIB family hydrolase n=1 Tax=Paraburkholderia bannensis TaxID=765414 RepID=UPI002ABE81D9|nr:HAD-IIB family hydrolase [Paraburkholderia bannensis]